MSAQRKDGKDFTLQCPTCGVRFRQKLPNFVSDGVFVHMVCTKDGEEITVHIGESTKSGEGG